MKNKTRDPFKILVRKYLCFAFAIFSIGISIATLTSLYLTKSKEFDGTTATIIMTFLVIAYTYFQYHISEIETEKRRINDLKLLAYKDIIKECNDLITDCNLICLNYLIDKRENKDIKTPLILNKEALFISTNLSQKRKSFEQNIEFYERLLNIQIDFSEYHNLKVLIERITFLAGEVITPKTIGQIFETRKNFNARLLKAMFFTSLISQTQEN